jgi:ABC-2 type transport system ATP-binding protein
VSEAIVLRGVTKAFGAKVAVRELDLSVPRGSLAGFIGPNGAGKTTTLRLILSILMPDRGQVSVLGRRSALEAKDRIGYLPEERGVYRKMKVGAFLAYMGRLKGLRSAPARERAGLWLEKVGLTAVQNKRCEELSKGMQQKVQFAAAVLHEPELVVLDEPFSGLDPVSLRLLRNLVLELRQTGTTILLSTHVMQQAEQLCERVVMIHEGHKVLDSDVAKIGGFDPYAIRLEPLDPRADCERLRALPGILAVEKASATWDVLLRSDANPQQAFLSIAAAVTPARIELRKKTLEDVFIDIVAGGVRAALDGAGPEQDGTE